MDCLDAEGNGREDQSDVQGLGEQLTGVVEEERVNRCPRRGNQASARATKTGTDVCDQSDADAADDRLDDAYCGDGWPGHGVDRGEKVRVEWVPEGCEGVGTRRVVEGRPGVAATRQDVSGNLVVGDRVGFEGDDICWGKRCDVCQAQDGCHDWQDNPTDEGGMAENQRDQSFKASRIRSAGITAQRLAPFGCRRGQAKRIFIRWGGRGRVRKSPPINHHRSV